LTIKIIPVYLLCMENDFDILIINTIINNPKVFVDNHYLFNEEIVKNKYSKAILQVIKEYYQKYNGIPSYIILEEIVKTEYGGELIGNILLDHLSLIKTTNLPQDQLEFITTHIIKKIKDNKLQGLKSNVDKLDSETLKEVSLEIERIDNIQNRWEIKHIWDEIEYKEREIIPTGLELIDKYGIAKGEIGLLMAATGVGKSVGLTFLANNFMLGGHKTLHIVFEGNIDNYIVAHRKKLGNPELDLLKRGKTTSNLKVIKLPSNQTTTRDIEEVIKLHITEDFTPDALVIDYVDCLVGQKQTKDLWVSDISIINELEHLAQKYNIAIWSAVQANRSGINKDLELSNAAGSISKIQKASMVVAITRTPEHQDSNTADLKVLKNRFGKLEVSINTKWKPDTLEIEAPIHSPIYL
jgi:hypothetical protein